MEPNPSESSDNKTLAAATATNDPQKLPDKAAAQRWMPVPTVWNATKAEMRADPVMWASFIRGQREGRQKVIQAIEKTLRQVSGPWPIEIPEPVPRGPGPAPCNFTIEIHTRPRPREWWRTGRRSTEETVIGLAAQTSPESKDKWPAGEDKQGARETDANTSREQTGPAVMGTDDE